jgi:hypothetical protein
MQKFQAEITTNSSSTISIRQNDDRPVPVHESSGYKGILVCQLLCIRAPGRARAMSARVPLKSGGVFESKIVIQSKKHRPGASGEGSISDI